MVGELSGDPSGDASPGLLGLRKATLLERDRRLRGLFRRNYAWSPIMDRRWLILAASCSPAARNRRESRLNMNNR